MRVILANPRGFCAGVNMAIESLNRALQVHGAPIYVFHEIVHNRHVVESFEARGVVFVDSLEEIPAGSVLLYSAHGVSPEVRRETSDRGLRAIDATCPLVTKVHSEAKRFVEQGYEVVFIGHAGHDEVIGTMGEAPGHIFLVETIEDVNRLTFPLDTRLAYLTQTTLSVDDSRKVIAALRVRYPSIVGPKTEDICYATQNRQDAVRRLAEGADAVLVVGSRNSSNSVRLTELAVRQGVNSYLIDSVNEIKPEWLVGVKTLLLTAGASAPEWIVQDCVAHLREAYGAEIINGEGRKENVVFALPKALAVERNV